MMQSIKQNAKILQDSRAVSQHFILLAFTFLMSVPFDHTQVEITQFSFERENTIVDCFSSSVLSTTLVISNTSSCTLQMQVCFNTSFEAGHEGIRAEPFLIAF